MPKNKICLKTAATCTALIIAALSCFTATADTNAPTASITDAVYAEETYYSKISAGYAEKGYADYSGEKINAALVGAENTEYTFEDKVYNGFVWDKEQEEVSFKLTVTEDGLYNIGVNYLPLGTSGADITRSLKIDGVIPFKEAESIEFLRFFRDTNAPLKDSSGNDVKPFSEECPRFEDTLLFDSDGKNTAALKFYLTAGEHTVTLGYIDEPMFIEKLYASAPQTPKKYADVLKDWEKEGKKGDGETLIFEAEDFDRVTEKTDSAIGLENSGDPTASPSSLYVTKMNYIGGAGYKSGNQSISWNFTVKTAGYYKLVMRVAQWYNDGLPSYRQIKLDGKVPFSEFDCYSFTYSDNWYTTTLSDGDTPYLLWLSEGEHTLTMTVKMGEYARIEESLSATTKELSALIRRIKMVTGEEPDNNYDYEIVKNVPGILGDLEELKKEMLFCKELSETLAGKKSSMSNSFGSVASQLEELINKPDRIPKRLSDLETALGNLGNWISTIKTIPLGIDYISFASPKAEIKNEKATVFQNLWHWVVKLVNSFFKDYQSVSVVDNGVTAETELDVWVGRGTEWCRLIKQLSDANFTPNSNAVIKINVLPSSQITTAGVNSLMLSVASGTAPDVVLGVGSSMPIEYAVRNAIVDLSKFDGFKETYDSLMTEAFKPLSYGGGVYALPETVSFRCIYYRTDIFKELGITTPNTWDEFYDETLPVLYQNGLKCFIPMLYDVFLYQNGGQYYTEDGHFTALDTPEAFTAFKQTCELNINYSIPVSANYFTRFRTGEMPMFIGQAADYLMVKSAAPEITGSWDIAPIPATKKADGTLDRSSCGLPVDCAVIMSQSKNKEKAWEFLRWWTGDDTQARFANQNENQLGVTARYFTANKNAFASLSFSKSEFNVINTFFDNNIESQVVLGGYYSARHVTNAWTRSVESGVDFRDSLEEAVEDINTELRRKQAEYGIYAE